MANQISAGRLEALRGMSYQEYLQTPEWQTTRKRILERDHYRCQGCNAHDVLLTIHHYTQERIGSEHDDDLVTLCEVCLDQLRRLIADPPKLSLMQKCSVGIGTALLGTIGIEGFLHAPLPAEIAVLIVAFLAAKNSPALYGKLKTMLPAEVMAWLGNAPEEGKPSWVDIALGRPARKVRRVEPGRDDPELRRRDDDDEGDIGERPQISFDGDDVVVPRGGASRQQNDLFVFSQLLDAGFVPSIKKIFVGRTLDGKDIFVGASDLCHVALAGKTGGGKGSLMRLIMVQLCYIGAKVLLLNPHYMRWVRAKDGPEFDEDWTPFEGTNPRTGRPYLEVPPIESADMEPIEEYLQWAVETLLANRKVEGREGGKRFVPYFIVLDEWPDIAGEIPKKAPDLLSKLLRQGRKYGIFVVVASQDFQVKTIGMDGGSVRKCLLTCFYTGGDTTTAKELLYSEAPKSMPENKLGKGVIMLRCVGTHNEPVLVRVPFVDNAAVYRLLGDSTFKKTEDMSLHDAGLVEKQGGEAAVVSTLYNSITTILNLYQAGKLTEEQMDKLIDALPVQADSQATPTARTEVRTEAVVQKPAENPNLRKLTTYHQRVLEHYEQGMTYRELGERISVGKDKAGELLRDLRRWGFLPGGSDEVDKAAE